MLTPHRSATAHSVLQPWRRTYAAVVSMSRSQCGVRGICVRGGSSRRDSSFIWTRRQRSAARGAPRLTVLQENVMASACASAQSRACGKLDTSRRFTCTGGAPLRSSSAAAIPANVAGICGSAVNTPVKVSSGAASPRPRCAPGGRPSHAGALRGGALGTPCARCPCGAGDR